MAPDRASDSRQKRPNVDLAVTAVTGQRELIAVIDMLDGAISGLTETEIPRVSRENRTACDVALAAEQRTSKTGIKYIAE